MPLIKRTLEPTALSRSSVAPGVRNELECVTNNTLANVIRQLSSLSKHAEDMFSELFHDASSIFERASNLQQRVDRLKVMGSQLDSTVEEVSLQDINQRKPFKSTGLKDQQVVNVSTRPKAIIEMYKQCDAPPPLAKLDPYREDGKDSMKFYTDPQYFFELWLLGVTKDAEMTKKEMKRRKNKKPGKVHREQAKIREVKTRKDEFAKMAKGKEFQPESQKVEYTSIEGHQVPDRRPDSLEITNEMNYLAGQDKAHPEPAPDYIHANGPNEQYQQNGMQYPGQTGNMTNHNYNDIEQNGIQPPGVHPDVVGGSPMQSPAKRAAGRSQTPQSSLLNSPLRPSQPPPAPPPGQAGRVGSPMGNRVDSTSRESLPPPPPPPPGEENLHRATPPYGSPSSTPAPGTPRSLAEQVMQRNSPLRQGHSPSPAAKSGTPDSADLPPPPSPPPMSPDTPGSISTMPPPPPMMDGGTGGPPPPPPPPPPLPSEAKGPIPNGNIHQTHALNPATLAVQMDSLSIASNSTLSSASTMKEPQVDDRSDLLVAIRKGIQLRKVEERRVKEETKRKPQGLDVQSIMEAAVEMRRKAMEANDSEEEEDSDMGWDSEDDT